MSTNTSDSADVIVGDHDNDLDIEALASFVSKNAARVAALGNWPASIAAEESLLHRIPRNGGTSSGLDAGLACALDLIPRQLQRLSAILHAAYTPDAIAQVQDESILMDPNSETCWWLAACSLCIEQDVDAEVFANQIADMNALAMNPKRRKEVAVREIQFMTSLFTTEKYGVPYGVIDGCMQGAYLVGHEVATMYDSTHDTWYIGTVSPSLRLEDFTWSNAVDDRGKAKSGPIHGSAQFVKCATEDEFTRALAIVRGRQSTTT